jgi:hypothetical protein
MENNYIESKIKSKEFIHKDNKVTICIAITINGFYIVGKSFCLDSKEFDEKIGEKYSFEDVIRQFEPMLGYHEKAYRYTIE